MSKQSNLAALRRYHNISQEKMARLLKINERTYMNKENGYSEFKLSEMFFISKLFNKSIEDIFLPIDFMQHEVDEIV